MAFTRAPARIPAHWSEFNRLVEECIDNYVDHNLYDDRAHAVREGVKAVVLDRQPVAEVEDDFAEDSLKLFRNAMRNCKTRLARVFGPRAPHEKLEKTLKMIDKHGDDISFRYLWMRVGLDM
ncbi:hypothetical protein AAVH_18314, partial [Aphelenchoides avenae]